MLSTMLSTVEYSCVRDKIHEKTYQSMFEICLKRFHLILNTCQFEQPQYQPKSFILDRCNVFEDLETPNMDQGKEYYHEEGELV